MPTSASLATSLSIDLSHERLGQIIDVRVYDAAIGDTLGYQLEVVHPTTGQIMVTGGRFNRPTRMHLVQTPVTPRRESGEVQRLREADGDTSPQDMTPTLQFLLHYGHGLNLCHRLGESTPVPLGLIRQLNRAS